MARESADKPLWQLLRETIPNVRGLARELAGPDATDRQVESHRRKINKWLDKDKPVTPSAIEARRVAKILGKPDDFFVRRPARETLQEKNARLEAELAQAHRELERLRSRGRRG